MMVPLLDQTERHYQGEQPYRATVSQPPMFGGRFPGELLRWPAIGNNVRFGWTSDIPAGSRVRSTGRKRTLLSARGMSVQCH